MISFSPSTRLWIVVPLIIFILLTLTLGWLTFTTLSGRETNSPQRDEGAYTPAHLFDLYEAHGSARALAAARQANLDTPAIYFEWADILMGGQGPQSQLAYAKQNLHMPGIVKLGQNLILQEARTLPPQQILNLTSLFNAHGLRNRLVNFAALDQLNLHLKLEAEIVAFWREGQPLSAQDHAAFLQSYGAYLSPGDHIVRFHRLLGNSTKRAGLPQADLTAAAALMRDLIPEGLDRVRVAWATGLAADRAGVPEKWQRHAALLSQDAWALQDIDQSQASALFRAIDPATHHHENQWRLRRILIRNAVRESAYHEAYELATTHGLGQTVQGHTADLLAGWLALTYLDSPSLALEHYSQVADQAAGPWLASKALRGKARSLHALNRTHEYLTALNACAAYQSTFYALLCLDDLDQNLPNPSIPQGKETTNPNFEQLYAITAMLIALDRSEAEILPFARAAFDHIHSQDELYRLATVLINRDDLAFTHTMGVAAYRGLPPFFAPAQRRLALNSKFQAGLEPALTLGVIAQESQFRETVQSPAGAVGLMQLLPSTAQEVADELGLSWNRSMLTNTRQNIHLGNAYLAKLLKRYDGALLLALAAYNAGPGNVERWLRDFGDPRTQDISPEDWIDVLTIGETRLYVQRVLTNLYLYRAALHQGDVALDLQSLMVGL